MRQIKAQGHAAQRAGATQQASALADGHVSTAELRQAYDSAVDCMRRAGLEVEDYEQFDAVFGPSFEFTAARGRRTATDSLRISDECEVRWDGFVAQAYAIQHGFRFTPTARVAVERCLHDKGVDIIATSAEEAIMRSPKGEDAVLCMIQAQHGHALGLGLSAAAGKKANGDG